MNTDIEPALRSKGSDTTDKGLRRAREILAEARVILAAEGYAGLSMRTLAARVGVNLSTVQHYYPSKDALLEALLLAMLQDYQAAVERFVGGTAQPPKQAQFEALVDHLLDVVADRESSAVMRELWALGSRNAFAAAIIDRLLTNGRKVLRNLIAALVPGLTREEGELRGALIMAQLQGLTLYLANPQPAYPELRRLKAAARAAIVQLATAPPRG